MDLSMPGWKFVKPEPGAGSTRLILRGLFSIVYGLFALLWPSAALYSVALILGAYVFVDGVLALTTHRHFRPWNTDAPGAGAQSRFGQGGVSSAPILEGVLGIIAGGISFLFPGLTAAALSLLVGAWAMATGMVEVVAASSARSLGALGRSLYALAGMASILLGTLILGWPVLGAWALITLVAVYALSFGFFMMVLGIHLRRGKSDQALRSGQQESAPETGRAA